MPASLEQGTNLTGTISPGYSVDNFKPKPDLSVSFDEYLEPYLRREIALKLPREQMTRSSLGDLSKGQKDNFMQVIYDEHAEPEPAKKAAALVSISQLTPEAEIQYAISPIEADEFSNIRLAVEFGSDQYPRTPENIERLRAFWQKLSPEARANILEEKTSIKKDRQRITRPSVVTDRGVFKWGRYDSWIAQEKAQDKFKAARAEELAEKMKERGLTLHTGGQMNEGQEVNLTGVDTIAATA